MSDMKTSRLSQIVAIFAVSISSIPFALGGAEERLIQKLWDNDIAIHKQTYNAFKAAKEPSVLSCNKAGGQEIEVEFDLQIGSTPQKIRAVISGSADAPQSVLINRLDDSSRSPAIRDIRIDYARPTAKDSSVEISEKSLHAAMTKMSWFERQHSDRFSRTTYYDQKSMHILKSDSAATKKEAPLQGIVQIGGYQSYINGLADGISAALPSFWKGMHERCANGTQAIGGSTAAATTAPSSSTSSASQISQ